MKVNGRWILSLALALGMASTAEGGVLDFFFGDEEAEEEIVFPEGAGWFLDEKEFELGKKGFYCLQEMAGVENESGWGQNLMRPISRVMLSAYGDQGIEMICNSQLLARMRVKKARSGNRKERKRGLREATPLNNVTMPERRTQQQQGICASWPANYAEGTGYDDFARSHLDAYLEQGDRTQRTNAVMTFSLEDQMSTLRMASSVLARCSSLWSTVNQFIAVPDVPLIDQAAISEAIQIFVCDLPGTYTNIAMMRLQRDQELINFHNELINGAEVGAMYQNTNTLMNELCARDSQMSRVLDEIEEIKNTVDRL